MGRYKNKVIIVSGYIRSEVDDAHNTAKCMFGSGIVTDVIESDHGSLFTFVITTDGHKESTDECDTYEEKRINFRRWMNKKHPLMDCGHLVFGGSDDEVKFKEQRYET